MPPPPKPSPFYIDDCKPFAQRHDGMSLDTIQPKDVPKGKTPFIKDTNLSLQTHDIHRAKPHYKHLDYLEKPDFSVGCTHPDHPGARAGTYYPNVDRRPRDLSLTTADIELAQAKGPSRKGNRHTDPLCPHYELPSHHARPLTPPRFNGRHTNDIGDIEFSRPKVLAPDRNYERDPNEARDIEFNEPHYQDRVKRPWRPREDRAMCVGDINGSKMPIPGTAMATIPSRTTNPLDPTYNVPTTLATSVKARFTEEHGHNAPPRTPEGGQRVHGMVPGSKPRQLTRDNGQPQFSLMREDIAGTVPQRWIGEVPANIYDAHEVRPMIDFHDPHDIPGAQVGSLRKGIVSNRVVNPLNPTYRMLDGDMKPPTVPVISGEREHLAHPSLRRQAASSSLPNLHAASQGAAGSGRATPMSTGRSMPRVASEGSLQRQQAYGDAAYASNQQQYSRPSSNYGAPQQQYSRPGSNYGAAPEEYGTLPPGTYGEPEMLRSGRSSNAGSRGSGAGYERF